MTVLMASKKQSNLHYNYGHNYSHLLETCSSYTKVIFLLAQLIWLQHTLV